MTDTIMLEETKLHHNLSPKQLIEHALKRQEGELASNGAFSTSTGLRSGRSPKDRFIVKDAITENNVNWGKVNQPIDELHFNALWQRAVNYLSDKEAFTADLRIGAGEKHYVPVKAINEYAWHNLFCQTMFVRPEGKKDDGRPSWTLLSVPGLKTDLKRDGVNSDMAVILNFSQRRVLLCGSRYAGEMKKAMFSVLNFLLTDQDILPMHCAANAGNEGDVALFFGLSGTGKTTLSSDPERFLIGDDEHGWSAADVFNFEGGCYAKCINLSREKEPVIWDAIKAGAIMENVVLDKVSKVPDFADSSLSQNSRAAYPREHIEKRIVENYAGIPSAVIFLTCDLYGVLPPVSKLSKEQAAYHFLSGYTALVGSTEVDSGDGIKPTFSTCFGAPFFPRRPGVYADLLMKRIDETNAAVYLVNTGWHGGAHGEGGERFSIPTTRAVIRGILNGELKDAEYETLSGFQLAVPKQLTGVDAGLLNPKNSWQNQADYEEYLRVLMTRFEENFRQFDVDQKIIDAGPRFE